MSRPISRFTVTPTPLAGLQCIERQRLGDSRGTLARLFCADELAAAGWVSPIAQINHTTTALAGTVRGMHYQRPPHAEMKLVSCLHGEVWDVAVDLRADSPTFLQWHGQVLCATNRCALLIPEGFAHGFQTLTDDVTLLYCHSRAYAPESEGGLNPLDARLAITWPQAIALISDRDKNHPLLGAEFKGLMP
jgi:dTDP-4-dehydrorhamnose 3,5-epimerase